MFASEVVVGGREAVVVEAMIGEEGPRVAMEAICATQTEARIVLGHEEFEAFFLLCRELCFPFGSSVEFRIEGGQREEKLFDGDSESVGGDFGVTKGPFEEARVIGCLLYTSPSPRDQRGSRMPSSA